MNVPGKTLPVGTRSIGKPLKRWSNNLTLGENGMKNEQTIAYSKELRRRIGN